MKKSAIDLGIQLEVALKELLENMEDCEVEVEVNKMCNKEHQLAMRIIFFCIGGSTAYLTVIFM